jgi:hypothetical protein
VGLAPVLWRSARNGREVSHVTTHRSKEHGVDISLDSVVQVRISDIVEFSDEELDEGDTERFQRTITIVTASGVITLDLNAASDETLALIEDDEG